MTDDSSPADESPLAVLWRRKLFIVAMVAVFGLATALVSASLPKVYSTQSTLLITVNSDGIQAFDSVQASQALARSYADIIRSPNIAQLVADRLPGDADPRALSRSTTFEPIPETQLLKITAEDRDPARAKEIADTYAGVFREYAGQRLAAGPKAVITEADAAPLPGQPARPKPVLYVTVALILGLALACALAFLLDRLDRRLHRAEDVEARIDANVPLLGRIPPRGRSETSVARFAEAHRILRKNFEYVTVHGRPRSVAVTSARDGEGKTTTVAQMARATAELGLRVLVVEADFRRSGVQSELVEDQPGPLYPGLSNYLAGTASLDEVIHPTADPAIDIVPPGPAPPSSSALLESADALTELLKRAELVLVDCPPVNAGADASVISGKVDGVVMVVDLENSTDRTVNAALRQLRAVRASILGLVVNRDRRVDVSRHNGHHAEAEWPPAAARVSG